MHNTKKVFLDEQKVIELHNKGLTERELAKYFKVSRSVISRYKKLLKLPNHLRANIDLVKLKQLIDKNYSDRKIANILNVKESKIEYHRRHTLKIKHREDKNRMLKLWTSKIDYWKPNSKFELQVLLGTLLGDASLSKSSTISARGSFNHCIKQKEYAKYKAKLLERLCTAPQYKAKKAQILKGRLILSTKQIHIGFKSSPYLLYIWKLLYPDNKKTITKEYLDLCGPVSLALYYFDDGYLIHGNTARITMYSFSDNERKLLVDWMYDKFGIEATYPKNIVHIRKKSASTFFKLIEPYCIDSMQYKLPK